MRDAATILMPESEAEAMASAQSEPKVREGILDAGVAPSAIVVRPGRIKLETFARVFWIVLATIGLCYFARAVVLPVALAWVAGMALKPPVRWLRDHGFPAPLASALILALFLVPIGFGITRVGRPAVEWIREAPENMVLIKERIGRALHPASDSHQRGKLSKVSPAPADKSDAPAVDLSDSSVATAVFSWTGGVLALIGEFVGLLFLLLTSGDAFLAKLVKVLPTLHDKRRAVEISHEIQQSISTYLFTVTLVNVILGTLAGMVFSACGLPHSAMWGVIVGALNFIPYFGPVIGVVAVSMSGILAFDSLGTALIPALSYLVIHLVEANAVTPMVLGRRFTLNPAVIFVMLIFFVWLWGGAGAFVAVPILVSAKVVCDRMPALQPLSEFLAR